MVKKTPLDSWIAHKIGVEERALTRDVIRQYQLRKLQETIKHASLRNPFYRQHLKQAGQTELASLVGLCRFPFTTADDLSANGHQFLAVSQSEIHRIVTLNSSGTTGNPKRVYFTADDQELTIDFFQHGVATMARPGDAFLILLPGERPGSVGDLLARGLGRFGLRPLLHQAFHDPAATIALIVQEQPQCVIGLPVQLLGLARYASEIAGVSPRFHSVVLVSDHVPDSIVRVLKHAWSCEVFEHYGMTEMGLGGGVDCEGHSGYHLREADLYFEIVDPVTSEPLPDGDFGEIVFTTLTRRGMPLIRYRTSDISRFVPGTCPCGSVLQRLDRVRTRKANRVFLDNDREITLSALDEALFEIPGLIDFAATVIHGPQPTLQVKVFALPSRKPDLVSAIGAALNAVPAISSFRDLDIGIVLETIGESCWPMPEKRMIRELRA